MPEISIGYLGPTGTFCEIAAENLFPKHHLDPYPNILSVIEALAQGHLTTGVLPMENLLEGTVTPVLDGLTSYPNIIISGEVLIKIEHHLMVSPGSRKKQLTGIFSHPHALAQCQEYLRKNFFHLPCQPLSSTAEAARRVALDLNSCAAIGNKRAAEIYGLEILERNIGDANENYTRFIVLTKEIPEPTGKDKTSIAFSLEHKPGTLSNTLVSFAQAGINLTKIESRPSRKVMGEYIFYVDFEGHVQDLPVKEVLKEVRKHTTYLSVMGSYPRNC
ncbi:MAG: prephenate dehydratase [Dehalobacterium sp.]